MSRKPMPLTDAPMELRALVSKGLQDDELGIYHAVVKGLSEEYKLSKGAELLILDGIAYNVVRRKRLQLWLQEHGDVQEIESKRGRYWKASEAGYLLNTVDREIEKSMDSLLMTPKARVKGKIGLSSQDFANFLGTIDAKTVDSDGGTSTKAAPEQPGG